MKQVVQAVSGGPVKVLEVPRPTIDATQVLVKTIASVISPGTERAVTELASSSLLAKARARPDIVKQVVRKARTEGLRQTARAVRTRLEQDIPLGYSAAGTVLEVGDAVEGIAPGQLVATAGAGSANHADYQAVPGLLCAVVPDGVDPQDASFATIASIALHANRLVDLGPGSKVVVVGLGLIGQLSVRLGQAAGCDVAAIDVAELPVSKARETGAAAFVEAGGDTTAEILSWSRGRGADAIIVAASGKSSDAIMRTPELCRDRATVVVVGDTGLELKRTPFYEKELTVRFARSYGPGRYEPSYEEWAVDYPIGYVRWTEGRNLEAVLDLMAAGRLQVRDLVTHAFDIEEAERAYSLIQDRTESFLGVQLRYSSSLANEAPITLRPRRARSQPSVGLIGAGSFARSVLVPSMRAAGFERFVSVASSSGLSARTLAEKEGFEKVVSGADAVIEDPDVDVVVIATPHDSHAYLTVKALRAGKHVFCEKPLALTMEELDEVEEAWGSSDGVLFVGFNRRWSEPVAKVREHFASGTGPLVINYRVNAGPIPPGHWYEDRRQGGRLIGEVCHFIDTCNAIVQGEALAATASPSSADDSVVVSLRYTDGSLAAITYSAGGAQGIYKEYVQVDGRGRSARIVDFRKLFFDSRSKGLVLGDKGHRAQMMSFLASVSRGQHVQESFLQSMRVTLSAAGGIGSGG